MAERISEKYIGEFFGLTPDETGKQELAEIKGKLKKMVFEHGHDIVTIDEEPDGMYFIESGTAVVLGREGEQLNILHIGQYFGEYGVLSGQKRLSTVRALGRTVVFKMESEDLLSFLQKHPDIYGEFMKRVYGQLSNKHSQILALSGMRKGVLTHPSNTVPLSHKQLLINYGGLLLIYILASLFIPADTSFPVFVIPIAFML
ncbi:MAG: cyclic nucleotide-binding domain-containing protein, partial [Lachnospiraceae bacterium]|nr:cyclic nucleotide-binding domain-containing protein [Lachnospiraceae bacterium]